MFTAFSYLRLLVAVFARTVGVYLVLLKIRLI